MEPHIREFIEVVFQSLIDTFQHNAKSANLWGLGIKIESNWIGAAKMTEIARDLLLEKLNS